MSEFKIPSLSLEHANLFQNLRDRIAGNVTGPILEILLDGMSVMFVLSKEYRKNIEGFDAGYQIQDIDGGVSLGFTFKNGVMKVEKKGVSKPNINVIFKDTAAMRDFLFSENPDILDFVLNSKVTYVGNLNYLMKFAYMAKHLQLRILK